jgi:hypothetical protein
MSSSPDIIKDASDALKPISDRGITVMQGWYDKDIHDRHVTLWDLGENDENFSDDDAEGVTLSVQVTIFSENDEVELAREIKSLMKENDFSFAEIKDLDGNSIFIADSIAEVSGTIKYVDLLEDIKTGTELTAYTAIMTALKGRHIANDKTD